MKEIGKRKINPIELTDVFWTTTKLPLEEKCVFTFWLGGLMAAFKQFKRTTMLLGRI